MAADIMELPVRLPAGDEAAAMGAALQALWCAERASGRTLPIAEIVDAHIAMDTLSEIFPDEQSGPGYREAYENYKRYLGALSPLYR